MEERLYVIHKDVLPPPRIHEDLRQRVDDVWPAEEEIVEAHASCWSAGVVTDAKLAVLDDDMKRHRPAWIRRKRVVVDRIDFDGDARVDEFLHLGENPFTAVRISAEARNHGFKTFHRCVSVAKTVADLGDFFARILPRKPHEILPNLFVEAD